MDDLISRQAALDGLYKRVWHENADEWMAVDTIVRLPAADMQEVRHGRWKPFDLTWGRSVYACSACGDAMEVPTEMGKPIFSYCPNCGSRMDEVEE